jgi:chromosome segregation protein
MRFNHLSLQGYKSFANKSEFLFPTGITAIVGPNGSGKSNIADAIRWVMGEQRMSSLRGKSTADMIYAGGRRRARSGVAEVSLTFDNSDNWLPIEFSEVTITRRAYRSGDNEYLINGSRVRLRDVAEMLAESGFSQHTYTVIGQGLVDAALSLRPQERRGLFEEAAGISIYRNRREDALRRLEETQHNLERAHDIVREIAPRLRRLEKEVEQVEEHHRLIAHLERLQRTWYGYHWGQRQATLARALEKAAYLESSLEKQRQEAAALSDRLVQQRQRESELRAQLRDWYHESGDLLDRVNETQRALAVAEERARLLKAQREDLLAELTPLDEQETTQSERVAQARIQVQEVERELTERRQQLAQREREWIAAREQAQEPARQRAEAEQELHAHRTTIEQLTQAMADARAEEAHLASEQAVTEERARQLHARREEILAEIAPLAAQEKTLLEHASQAQAEVERLERELADHTAQLAEAEREWAVMQQQAQKPEQRRAEIERELQAHRDELKQLSQTFLDAHGEEARVKGEMEVLKRIHETGDAHGSSFQALLQADLTGVLGPLSSFVQVPPRWERAVEAALGPDLQAIVVEQVAIAEEARRIIESSGGRLTLLPLDSLRPTPPLPAGTLRAADIVTCEVRMRPAVEALLGGIALCDDLAAAQALLPAMPSGSRCATPAGVVLRADGAVVIGQARSGGMLADERARRELPARLAEIEQRVQEIGDQQQTASRQIAALEAELEELTHQAAIAREDAARVEREKLSKARTEIAVANEMLRNQQAAWQRERTLLEQLQEQRAALSRQLERLEEEHAVAVGRIRPLEHGAELQNTGERQAPLPTQIEAAKRRREEIETQLHARIEQTAALESRLEALTRQAEAANEEAARIERETVAKARTEAAVAEETLRSGQAALQREEALLERLQAQRAARRQRVEELEAESAAIAVQIEELRAEASRLETQLGQSREHIQPAEDELARLGKGLAVLEEQERLVRDRSRDSEARHGHAQLEVARCQDELKLLAERIEEDLGLVELELADSVTAQTPLPLRPVVSELPIVKDLPQGLEEEIQRLKAHLRRLGGVNPNAPEDYAEVKERHEFLTEQSADLEAASERLHRVVAELDELMETNFRETFDAVAARFEETFTILFNGGAARLELTEPDDLMNTGVDIVARPPGKRSQRLALLSGGERSLTAVALLFAILQVSPAPFCVLDEVDAALDEANIGRFRSMLQDLAKETQFIIITHNRGTIEAADTIYGISMGSDGVSQSVSLKLD